MSSNATCAALTATDSGWSFCPSFPAAIFGTVMFGSVFIAHLVQAFYYRQGYAWVICMSALWQLANYIFRVLSIKNPSQAGFYSAWFILMMTAPIWTNAYVYMVLGRMVWVYVPGGRIFKVSAWRFGLFFVLLDILAFLIQATGGIMASGTNIPTHQLLLGLHIYMIGIGVQQFFIFLFSFCIFKLWRILMNQKRSGEELHRDSSVKSALTLLYALVAVLVLITIRIIFRLIEYSHGLNSSIPNHEAFQYCLDSLPMFFAFIILNIVHPGRIMRGDLVKMPGRKERKRLGLKNNKDGVLALQRNKGLLSSAKYQEVEGSEMSDMEVLANGPRNEPGMEYNAPSYEGTGHHGREVGPPSGVMV